MTDLPALQSWLLARTVWPPVSATLHAVKKDGSRGIELVSITPVPDRLTLAAQADARAREQADKATAKRVGFVLALWHEGSPEPETFAWVVESSARASALAPAPWAPPSGGPVEAGHAYMHALHASVSGGATAQQVVSQVGVMLSMVTHGLAQEQAHARQLLAMLIAVLDKTHDRDSGVIEKLSGDLRKAESTRSAMLKSVEDAENAKAEREQAAAKQAAELEWKGTAVKQLVKLGLPAIFARLGGGKKAGPPSSPAASTTPNGAPPAADSDAQDMTLGRLAALLTADALRWQRIRGVLTEEERALLDLVIRPYVQNERKRGHAAVVQGALGQLADSLGGDANAGRLAKLQELLSAEEQALLMLVLEPHLNTDEDDDDEEDAHA